MNRIKVEFVLENINDEDKIREIKKILKITKNAKLLSIKCEKMEDEENEDEKDEEENDEEENDEEEEIVFRLDKSLKSKKDSFIEYDEMRRCAGCNITSKDKDLCTICEPFRENIKQRLDMELNEYMKKR